MLYINDVAGVEGVARGRVMRIDDTDFAILKCVRDLDRPLWKNKIHECIKGRFEELPLGSTVSVQTVGRRVDDLTDNHYLESCIISPDEIKRDLIIAFKLTDKGRESVEEKTEEYLQRVVQAEMFPVNEEISAGKPAVIELMKDRFDLEDDTVELLSEEYSRAELVTLVTLYYVKREISDVFTEDTVEKFVDLADSNEKLSEALNRYMLKDDTETS